MFGYSIKEVLEDNSMDIYMIMEALDTQKDWKERFLEKMGLVLLNYYSEECAC